MRDVVEPNPEEFVRRSIAERHSIGLRAESSARLWPPARVNCLETRATPAAFPASKRLLDPLWNARNRAFRLVRASLSRKRGGAGDPFPGPATIKWVGVSRDLRSNQPACLRPRSRLCAESSHQERSRSRCNTASALIVPAR
jgi:hypothetical protein